MTMLPVTALPLMAVRVRITVFISTLVFIDIIDAKQATGEGADLSECDEERFVYLPKRGDIDAAK
jgi:hypothetical protein